MNLAMPAIVASSLLAAGCGAFYLEAEQPQVCITQDSIDVPITTSGVSGGFSSQVSFDVGKWLPGIGDNGPVKGEVVRFLQMRVSLPQQPQVPNLDWLTSFDVTLVSPTSDLPPVALLHYQKPAGSETVTSLSLDSTASNEDISAYIRQGALTVTFSGSGAGQLPPPNWLVNVGGCFYASVRKDLSNITQ